MTTGRQACAVLCVALWALSGCSSAYRAGFDGTVQVLLVDVFSGPAETRGVYQANSLQVEIDDLNAHGGLLGSRVELVAADDELKPAKAAQLVREDLLGGVALLVGPGSADAYASAMPSISRAAIPNCLPAPVPDASVAGAAATFRTRESERDRTAVLLSYVSAHTQVRRIGVATADAADIPAADRLFGELAAKSGLQYLGAASVASTDPTALVEVMIARGAQGLVLPDDAAAAAAVAHAIHAVEDPGTGGQLAAFGFGGLGHAAYPLGAGDAAIGTTFVSPILHYLSDVPESSWPAAYRTFVKRIAGRYGYAPDSIELEGVPSAADCLLLWARAVRVAGTFDGAAVARAWQDVRVPADEAALGAAERFAPAQSEEIGLDGLHVYQWAKRGGQYRLKRLGGS